MPDTRGTVGFGGGFAQTSGAMAQRRQVEVAQEKLMFEQRKQLRDKSDASVADSLSKLELSAKGQSAAFFSELEETGRQKIKDIHTRTAQTLWGSTQQMLEAGKQQGLYNDAEIANIKEQFRIAATLNNPVAEQKLEEQVKTEGAIATAEGKQPLELEQIQERGRQARLTRATQTTENINTRDLNKSVVSGLQTDQIAGEQIAFESRELADRLTAADVGFRGAAGELVFDEILGQLFESAVNKDRVKNRQAIRTVREKALRTMTTDNRLNREDRAGVEKIFPKDSAVESLAAAREKLTSLAELMEQRAARVAGQLNVKATHLMSTAEIKSAVANGQMNRDQALRALRVYHGFE